MRNFVAILFIGLSLMFVGCNNDDEEQEQLWYSYGTYFELDSVDNGFIIELDNGNQLIPVEVDYIDGDVVDSNRVIVLYSIESEQDNTVNARVKQVSSVLTKGVIQLTEENQDSIGNDAVIVYDDNIWFSKNHLNVIFSYYGSIETHFINLVKPIDSLNNSAIQVLEFRHNANNDYPLTIYTGGVSFDMWSLYEEGMDSINFIFKSTNYNNVELSWEGTYYFNNNVPTNKAASTIPINLEKVY